MQKCCFKHGKHTSNMMFFTKFAISPVPGADFQGEVLILPSEVLQSNLSGQVGLLFSCPSSQVVNLWGGYHQQKICQDVTESHACSKYQWQPLKRFFLAQSDVFYGDAFHSQKNRLLSPSQTLRSCFTVRTGANVPQGIHTVNNAISCACHEAVNEN